MSALWALLRLKLGSGRRVGVGRSWGIYSPFARTISSWGAYSCVVALCIVSVTGVTPGSESWAMCPYALLSAVLGIDYLAHYECCSILLCVRRVCRVCWRGSEGSVFYSHSWLWYGFSSSDNRIYLMDSSIYDISLIRLLRKNPDYYQSVRTLRHCL